MKLLFIPSIINEDWSQFKAFLMPYFTVIGAIGIVIVEGKSVLENRVSLKIGWAEIN